MEETQQFDLKKLTLLNKIGSGSFGEVYRAKDNETGDIYAAKISLSSLDDIEDSEDSLQNLSREVNIMAKLNHPCILKFIGFCKAAFNGEPQPVIITEFISKGSLENLILLERQSLADKKWNDTQKLITIYGIAAAMSYLHSHNIIHRDLKLQTF